MQLQSRRRTNPIQYLGWVLSVILALTALGWALPWDTQSRAEAAATFATKEDLAEVDKRLQAQDNTLLRVHYNLLRVMERLEVEPVDPIPSRR
jgi:hypothetical protein